MTLEAIAKADGTVSRRTVERHVGHLPNVPTTITDTKGHKLPYALYAPSRERRSSCGFDGMKKARTPLRCPGLEADGFVKGLPPPGSYLSRLPSCTLEFTKFESVFVLGSKIPT